MSTAAPRYGLGPAADRLTLASRNPRAAPRPGLRTDLRDDDEATPAGPCGARRIVESALPLARLVRATH